MGFFNDKQELYDLRAKYKAMKKRAKRAEKKLEAIDIAEAKRFVPALSNPKAKAAENIIQKLAESLDAGGGMTSASKLASWRAARTAEHRSAQNALTMGPIGTVDLTSN